MTEPQRGFVLVAFAFSFPLAPRWLRFRHWLRFSSLSVSHNLFTFLFFGGDQIKPNAELRRHGSEFQIQFC